MWKRTLSIDLGAPTRYVSGLHPLLMDKQRDA